MCLYPTWTWWLSPSHPLHYALPIIALQLPKLHIIPSYNGSILDKTHKRQKYGEFTMQSTPLLFLLLLLYVDGLQKVKKIAFQFKLVKRKKNQPIFIHVPFAPVLLWYIRKTTISTFLRELTQLGWGNCLKFYGLEKKLSAMWWNVMFIRTQFISTFFLDIFVMELQFNFNGCKSVESRVSNLYYEIMLLLCHLIIPLFPISILL